MQRRSGPLLTEGTALTHLDEEQILARILPLYDRPAWLVVPPGDDAAVLHTSDRTIATTDSMVLGRDWLDEWSSGADVGHKVIAQNLADIAAMGGRPTGVLLTLVIDPAVSIEWVTDLAKGVAGACSRADVAVLGGDLSSAPPGVVMVSVTALGVLVGEPVLRSGARPGNHVAVAGSLGLSDAGLRLLQEGRPEADPEAVAVHRRPRPPLDQGLAAVAAGATAMLDVSDGLLRDAGRIARASGVILDLDPTALDDDIDRLTPVVGVQAARECVLAGGEEHALLATFVPGSVPGGWRVIGVARGIAPDEGPEVLVGGLSETLTGWDHFRP
ncbi:MAG: thiamine-phosphate kinase [Intrasporangium sp.]|uniref:thiamine-phosphate kinase n=1 Tax=Intrasporangium sp. TaxID=1925024 RepID=UPI002647A2BD|nr:thiamine-phosphate kinase [Intrasporangium sp.]MDN5794736.1 thiamine-phosphate kinase [Intrasporangium sp.]